MKNNKFNPFVSFMLSSIIISLVFTACGGGSEVRQYTEKETPAPAAKDTVVDAADPHGHMSAHFKWVTPEGWSEDNKSSGIRLATFTLKEDTQEAICTIIPLQGEAGGLRANVERWAGQINLEITDMDKFLAGCGKFITKGNFPAVLVDYTPLTSRDEGQSMLVSVITVGGSTVFIKATGEKSLLVKNRDKFKALSQSFTSTTGT